MDNTQPIDRMSLVYTPSCTQQPTHLTCSEVRILLDADDTTTHNTKSIENIVKKQMILQKRMMFDPNKYFQSKDAEFDSLEERIDKMFKSHSKDRPTSKNHSPRPAKETDVKHHAKSKIPLSLRSRSTLKIHANKENLQMRLNWQHRHEKQSPTPFQKLRLKLRTSREK